MSEKENSLKFEIEDRDERDDEAQLRDPNPIGRKPTELSPIDDPELTSIASDKISQLQIEVVNRAMIWPGQSDEGVSQCRVNISEIETTTNQYGNTTIDLSGLDDGVHDLTALTPNTQVGPVGPGFPTDTSLNRIWDEFTGIVHVEDGSVTRAEPSEWIDVSGNRIKLALKPLWMRAEDYSPRNSPIDLIVVHHTGSHNLRSGLRAFLYSGQVSVHYVVAANGEVYKLVDESKAPWHAGSSYWRNLDSVNSNSIGIEIVHGTGSEYPPAQVDAVVDLVSKLASAYPNIPAENVVGHSDVGVTRPKYRPPKRHGRKSTDPGSAFPWERIEALGFGLIAASGTIDQEIYGGFFKHYPASEFRDGDSDNKHRYGGKIRRQVSGAIEELQNDLDRIGYWCKPFDGVYGSITAYAVKMFQQHIFSGARRKGTDPYNSGDGNVDLETAELIKRVIGQVNDTPVS